MPTKFKVSTNKIFRLFVLALAMFGATSTSVKATVVVSPLYGNNMVIQRGTPFPVGGTAAPNKLVTVSYNGQTNSVTSDMFGSWQLTLPSMNVQFTGSNLIIKEAGGNTLTFSNVVVGDVWLFSGQSNMGITPGTYAGSQDPVDATAISGANFPGIRCFGFVPLANLANPTTSFNGGANWTVCSPGTAGSISSVAFYFGRAIYTNQNSNVPIGLEVSCVGGTRIDPWLGPEGLTDIPVLAPLYSQLIPNYGPFSLFNGMIYPLAPLPVKGVIWYQGENGESTTQSADSYYLKLKGLISGWKRLLGVSDCAFYVVQIANWGSEPASATPVLSYGGWDPDTRLQQGNALNLPHAGVATAIDIGSQDNMHPTNKWDVGIRLSLWAMKNEYGQTNLVTSGPVLSGVTVSSNAATCTFNYAGNGLMVGYKDSMSSRPVVPTNAPLALFSIAGANGVWYWANATITSSNTVQLTSANVPNPMMVSYACWQCPTGANLYNSNGLPALPFYVTNITTTFTVTASAGAGGSISPAGATSYLQRMTALYTITPNLGYYVQSIQVDGTNVGPVAFYNSTAYYTFDPLYANHTITAIFTNAVPTNTVTATSSGGGTITPSGIVGVPQGGAQSFTITTNPGCQLSLAVDGKPMGTRSSFNFSDLTINHTITASFSCTINASSGFGGSITPPGVTNIIYGSNMTYTVTPAATYSILKVTVDGTNVGALASYTFTNVTTSHTITASFTGGTLGGIVPQTNNLLFSCLVDSLQTNGGGTITGWPTYIPSGSSLTPMNLAPTLATIDGRPFAQNYYLSSPDGFNERAYSSPIPCSGATIVVVAKPIRNGVAGGWGCVVDAFYNQLSLGVLNDTGQIMVLLNGNQVFTPAIIPNGQTTILSLVVQSNGQYMVWANGSPIYTNNTVNPLTSLVNGVAGSFANNITIGNNYPDGWSAYNGYIGDLFFYTNALSNTNRALLEQYLATRLMSGNGTNYTITSSAGSGGVISPSGVVLVASGSNQSFTITCNTGYSISSVVVDGVSQGAISSYTFNNVTTNHAISVTFAYNGHTITATAGMGGSITPSGAVPVSDGSNQSFTISANAGGAVTNVVVDGVSQGAVTSYTFTNVTANHTIAAAFSYTNYTITATAGTGGLINPAGGVQVGYGSNQLFTVTANPGYAISNVLVDNISQGGVSSYLFSNVTNDHTIVVTYSLAPALGGIISVNYCQANDILPATAVAGVVATNHWNSIIYNGNSSGTSYSNPTNTFYDCSGAVVSGFAVKLSTDSNSGYNTGIINNSGDYSASLYSEFALNLGWGGGSPVTGTVTFTNIPYPQYDLYIYDIGYIAGSIVTYTVGATTVILNNNNVKFPLTQGGNFVKLTALTNQNPVVTVSYGSGSQYSQQGISAFQIVQDVVNYTIAASAGTGGTINPNGAVAANLGANQTFVITANTGYCISNVVVDGVSQGSINSYTFTNVMVGHVINVSFAMTPLVLSAANLTLSGGIPTFIISNSLSGHQYTLVYKNNLMDSSWTSLTGSGTMVGTGGTINLSDTNSIQSLVQRFYRLQMQ